METLRDPNAVLDLSDQQILQSGRQRNVYLLRPDGSLLKEGTQPLVLKVPRYQHKHAKLSLGKRILRKIHPQSAYRVITKEADYVKKVSASERGLPIPAFVSFVETNQGRGVLWEAICDENGDLAPTLNDICKAGKANSAIGPLNAFVASCFEQHIVAPDVHAGNLILVRRDGQDKFILVDGFGDHRVISIREFWPRYNAKSLNRSFSKMARKTGLSYDETSRRFAVQD